MLVSPTISTRLFILPVTMLAAAALACGSSERQATSPASQDAVSPSAPDTQTATADESPQPGSSSSDPAPIGSETTVEHVTLSIIEVVFPADDLVRQGSELNPTPVPSTHYLFVTLSATCDLGADQACPFGRFRLVDSDGVAHFPEISLAGVPCGFEGGEFLGGSRREPCFVFTAPQGDQGPTLKYESFFGEEVYLALQ
jgi:hypothetical protein